MSAPLIAELADVVGAGHVLLDADARAGYEHDWTGRWQGSATAVVRPGSTREVSEVVGACSRAGVAIVPQGGNTGLVGGGVPRPGAEIVLSTARLDDLLGVDPALAQLHAGAGVTLARAQAAARENGLELPLDLAARDSATLGGLVACDAGGLRALRHGTARRQLVGVEAVLADGAVVRSRMSGLVKDTAGYDLAGLLAGSEGTLGVICAVRWSLVARRPARAVALVGLDSVQAAAELAARLRPRLAGLELMELMERPGLELTLAHLRRAAPIQPLPEVAVLLEYAAEEDSGVDPLERLADALAQAGADERAVSAADGAGRARLFELREAHAEAVAAAGVPLKLDVGVPLGALGEFRARVGETVARLARRARIIVWGHLGDGNLHVNLLGIELSDPARVHALETAVLELVAGCGGTISAEHGIGVHKPAFLALSRSGAEIAAMRAIKRALDPAGILNPGVGLPTG